MSPTLTLTEVKSHTTKLRVLLRPIKFSHKAKMLSAWQALQIQYGTAMIFDLVHCSVVPENETLVILDLLDRVRAGFFSSVSQLAESECRRPLGFLTNKQSLLKDLYLGWPSLFPCGKEL